MTYAKRALLALVVGYATMGSQCINDPFVVSVNVEALTATISVPAGTATSYNGTVVVSPDDYLTTDLGSLQNVRIYDITVQTVGTYAGNVTGTGSVNGQTIASYSGPWSTFATPQSILTASSPVTLSAAGVTALRNAVLAQASVTLAGAGTVSVSPVPTGLSVVVKVFAQVDAEP
jgi:hypothetical protein